MSASNTIDLTRAGKPITKRIITKRTDFFGNTLEGEWVKIGPGYAELDELINDYDRDVDKWLQDKLK